jgi:hypothetical protein
VSTIFFKINKKSKIKIHSYKKKFDITKLNLYSYFFKKRLGI